MRFSRTRGSALMVTGRYPTLKDVAKHAGTTPATVSYALSGKEGRYISPEMRERVMAAVIATGYVKSGPASSLHGKHKGIIAVLVPQFENQFFTHLVAGVDAVVDHDGYLLSIGNTLDDPEREQEMILKLAEQRVDGFILAPTADGARSTEIIRRIGVPLVLVDRPLQGATGPFTEVLPDNYQCGHVAGEYLGSQGHREVAFLGWESGFAELDNRRRGFWEGLAAATGSTPHEMSYAGAFSIDDGYELAAQVHHDHPELTAWCLAYNVPAQGSLAYLRDHRVTVGEELSVVMIGNPDWARAGMNDITLVDPSPRDLGKQSAQQLLRTLTDPQATADHITVECQFHLGSSVSPVRTPSAPFKGE